MKRVSAIVDGLNLFHALRAFADGKHSVDIRAMSARMIHRNREVLTEVLYFSAVAAHLSDSEITKQRTFLTHLEASGVAIELGRFAKRQRQCSNCNRQYTVFEEKETDVAIATALLRIAFMQSAEKIFLFSTPISCQR